MKNKKSNLNPYPLKIFGITSEANYNLALKIAKLLKVKLDPCNFKLFKNGEFLVHHTESIRDCDVFLIFQPRFGDKYKLSYDLDECESLVFALRQGQPNRITVVIPCLPYSRQDKPSNYREPVLVQKIPMRLQMAGACQIVTLKLHNKSSYNAHPFTIPIIDINTEKLFIREIMKKKFNLKKFMIVAADLGAAPDCRQLARKLGIPENIIIINKIRNPQKSNHAEIMEVIGNPSGYNCIIPDDMADTCGTGIKVAKALKENGALDLYFMATHAILSGDAIMNLNSADFKETWFTNSCLNTEKSSGIKNLKIISVSNLIANIIDNLHNGNSTT